VGDIPAALQPKLLRVLQEQEFERLGSNRTHRVDVRLVAATNRNLREMVGHGEFRCDLYYRLNVFPILMPPLRVRRDDIPALVTHFVEVFGHRMRRQIDCISRETMSALCSYDWPGNIRELQNVIERSIVLCESETFMVDESWLSVNCDEADRAPRMLLRIPPSDEKKAIEAALADAQGQVSGPTGAAAKLGIPPSTLDSKIRAFKINKHLFKSS
jgi:transcriptional regulator with GAF, ATPase, and Fis domain